MAGHITMNFHGVVHIHINNAEADLTGSTGSTGSSWQSIIPLTPDLTHSRLGRSRSPRRSRHNVAPSTPIVADRGRVR